MKIARILIETIVRSVLALMSLEYLYEKLYSLQQIHFEILSVIILFWTFTPLYLYAKDFYLDWKYLREQKKIGDQDGN